MRLTSVEGFRSFTESTCETVVDKGVLENSLESVLDGHLTLGGGIGGDLNLLLRGFNILGGFFSVRLYYPLANQAKQPTNTTTMKLRCIEVVDMCSYHLEFCI